MYIGFDMANGKGITVYHGKFRQPLMFDNMAISRAAIVNSIIGNDNNGLRIDSIVDTLEGYLEISFTTCDLDIIEKIRVHENISCVVSYGSM
jgi:hypothetical protein